MTWCPYLHASSFVCLPALVGNPAAVVLLPPGAPWPPDSTLLRTAAELNLSETAFLRARPPPAGDAAQPAAADAEGVFFSGASFDLRWFSPKREVAMCGHGTLAAAHALFAWRGNPSPRLSFHTLSGELVVSREGASCGGGCGGPPTTRVRMCFPEMRPSPRDAAEPLVAALASALLGAAPPFPVLSAHYSGGARKLLLVCPPGSGAAIAALAPSMAALLAVPQGGERAPVEGVTLTARGAPGDAPPGGATPDFVQRYWSPWNLPAGEDPVNGSSHTLLAPFWAAELGAPPGAVLVSRGLSPRGGVLRVSVLPGGGADGRDAVAIEGEAATWAEGRLWV